MAEYNWDWRKNLPPAPAMSVLGVLPGLEPMTEAGVPGSTPNMVRPYTNNPVNPGIGPGFAPNVTSPGVAGTALQPGLLGFGSPGPVGDPEKTWKEKALEATLQNKDFMGGLALLAKAATGKAPAPPHPFKVSAGQMGGGLPSHAQAAAAAMQQAQEKMAGPEWDLTAPPTRKRKPRHQDRYDILKGQ